MVRARGSKTGVYRRGHVNSENESYYLSTKKIYGGSALFNFVENFFFEWSREHTWFLKVGMTIQDFKIKSIKNLLIFELDIYYNNIVKMKTYLFYKWQSLWRKKFFIDEEVNAISYMSLLLNQFWENYLGGRWWYLDNVGLVLNNRKKLYKSIFIYGLILNGLVNKMKLLNFYRYCSFFRKYMLKIKLNMYKGLKKLFKKNEILVIFRPNGGHDGSKVKAMAVYASRRFQDSTKPWLIMRFLFRQLFWLKNTTHTEWERVFKSRLRFNRCISFWILFKGRLTKRLRKKFKLRHRGPIYLGSVLSRFTTFGFSVPSKYGTCGMRIWLRLRERKRSGVIL